MKPENDPGVSGTDRAEKAGQGCPCPACRVGQTAHRADDRDSLSPCALPVGGKLASAAGASDTTLCICARLVCHFNTLFGTQTHHEHQVTITAAAGCPISFAWIPCQTPEDEDTRGNPESKLRDIVELSNTGRPLLEKQTRLC